MARANRLRRNRHLKRRLLACAEHFNRSYKKGLAYMQEIKLLPEPLEAKAVARFLKFAPMLARARTTVVSTARTKHVYWYTRRHGSNAAVFSLGSLAFCVREKINRVKHTNHEWTCTVGRSFLRVG